MAFSAARVLKLATGIVNRCKVSPFIPGSDCVLRPAGSYHVYSTPVVAKGDSTRYWAIPADGSTVTFAAPAALNPLLSVVAASLNDANRLRVVALINGSPQVFVGADASLAAGQFQCSDTTHITFFVAPPANIAGQDPKVEVLSFLAGDITDSGALTSGVAVEFAVPGYVTASGSVTLEPLPHH